MKRQFANRVATERKVLKVVNNTYGSPTLNGLSRNAVAAWKATNCYATKRVVLILEELAKRAMLEADVSRNVFDQEGVEMLEAIDCYVDQLQEQLKD